MNATGTFRHLARLAGALYNTDLQTGATHATRNDRARPDGRQHGAAADRTAATSASSTTRVAERRGRTRRAEKATGAASLADFVSQARQAARDLADGAGGGGRQDASPTSLPHLEAGDIVIDGGNSYYVDDIRRAKELAAEGHPLRRRRDERRRVGPRARLLHDDRRRERRSCSASIRSSRRSRPGVGDIDAHARARRAPAAPPSRATCTAGRTAPGTS